MFTGIIQDQAVLKEKKKDRNQLRLTFELQKPHRFQKGESVAVDGVCLTVTSFRGRRFSADILPETLQATTLNRLNVGGQVNIEHPLRSGDPVGGHWVTGHVDGVGRICRKERKGRGLCLQIRAPAGIIRLLIKKGSLAVDGISFTLQDIQEHSFVVGVTPHTARVTTLGKKGPGGYVNLENDLLIKAATRFSPTRRGPSLTERFLRKQGF